MASAVAPVADGSEPLPDKRQEAFAIAVGNGERAAVAYVNAGYSASGAVQGASRLLTRVNIARRVAYFEGLKTIATQAVAVVDSQRIQQELESWVLSDIGEMFDDTDTFLALRKMRAPVRRAIQSIKLDKEGKLCGVTLVSKEASMRQLREHMGLIKAPGDLTGLLQVLVMYGNQPSPPEIAMIGAKGWESAEVKAP